MSDIQDAEVRRMITYIEGFTREPSMQPAAVRGDPQLQWLKGYINNELERQDSPIAILDYGCGNGPLLQALYESQVFSEGEHQYIGVDLTFPAEAHALALQLGALEKAPQPDFLTCGLLFSRDAEDFTLPIRFLILRNVLHEIPLRELPHTLFHLTKICIPGTVIIIQEMIRLREGELGAVTWDPDDFQRLFPSPTFSVVEYSDLGRSGLPWMTVTIKVTRVSNDSEATWQGRCREVALYKLKKIRRALELYRSNPPDNRTGYEYVHLTHMYTLLNFELEEPHREDLYRDFKSQGISIGPTYFPVIVLEGEGEFDFSRQRIVAEVLSQQYKSPRELERTKETIVNNAIKQARTQGAVLFNGQHYGLYDYRIDITDAVTEERRLILSLKPTTYYDHIASNLIVDEPVLRASGKSCTPRFFYNINPGNFRESPLANQLGVNIAIITRPDNSLLYALRGEKTFTFSAGFVTGINAAMTRGMDEDMRGNPDLISTILREAKEELGLEVARDNVEILAFIQELRFLQPMFVGCLFVDESAETIMKIAAVRARDRFEYKGLLAMPFEPAAVAKHITTHYQQWVPQCAVATLYTLIRVFGYEETRRAFEGKVVSGFGSTSGGHCIPTVRRYIREFIIESLRKHRPTGPILDLGSGYRSARSEILSVNPTLEVKTADLNPALKPDLVLDAMDMKVIPDASFGSVVCIELLEHVEEPERVIREIHRILRPGGLLILTVPFAVMIHERSNQTDYWQFTPSGLRYLLQKRFRDVIIRTTGESVAPLNVMATALK